MKVASLFALTFAAAASFAQVDPNRVVMVVNGEEIKGSEYYERMEFLSGVGTRSGDRFLEASPGFLALNRLIEEKLLMQVAKTQGVFPTTAEIAQIYAEKAENKEFESSYKESGVTKAYVEYQIMLELCQFKLQTKGINVTDQQVEKHYKENPSRFTIPKKTKLSVIAAPEFRKADVDKALASGKAFGAVAKEMSTDPTSQANGVVGYVSETEMSDVIRTLIKDVKVGGLSAWLEGEGAWLRFRVDDIVPQQLKPLDANMKRDLRRSLMVDLGMVKNDVEKWLREARKAAKIEVKQPQFKNEVTKMLERYKIGG